MTEWQSFTLADPHAGGGHTYYVNPLSDEFSFLAFYLPSIILLVVGWLAYIGLNLTFSKRPKLESMRQNAAKMATSAGEAAVSMRMPRDEYDKEMLNDGVIVTKATAGALIGALWLSAGVCVQILSGDKGVNAFPIILVFLMVAFSRFTRLSSSKDNINAMVPNLAVVVALICVALGYVDSMGASKTLYLVAFAAVAVAAFYESVMIMFFPKAFDGEAEAVYVIPKYDYVPGVLFLAIFSIWELLYIAWADSRRYALPFFALWAYAILIIGRIVVFPFIDCFTLSKTTRKISGLAIGYNFVVAICMFLTVFFAHVNVCSMSPVTTMKGCMSGDLRWEEKDSGRVLLFSIFSMISLLFFWIGYIRTASGQNKKAMQQREILGAQYEK